MSEKNRADQLILFFCSSPSDVLNCWDSYSADSYRVLLFAQGGMQMEINGEVFLSTEKSVIFMRDTDECIFVDSEEEPIEPMCTECYAIYIEKNHYEAVKKLLGDSPKFDEFETEALPRLFQLDDIQCDKMIRELKDFNQSDEGLISEHLNSTKLLVASMYYAFIVNGNQAAVRFSDAPRWFNEYYELVSRPEVFTKSFESIVEISGKTREHLSRVFKSVTGITISEFVLSKRINYASVLLKNMKLSISDVMNKSGFTNVGTFYTNFKKRTGESPERYRKMLLTGESFSRKKK